LFAQKSPPTPKTNSPSEFKPLIETIIAKEKASWEAFKNHDASAFVSLCTDEFYEIDSGGNLITLKELLADMPNYETPEYTMDEVVVTVVNEQTAIIRYKILAKYIYKGKELPSQWAFASSIWTKKGTVWKAAAYQETLLPKKS
jgi:hypothetical protein